MYAQGGIFLLIHRMTATFGKLQARTLELKKGLNILQAPNETGKSTWSAFLVAMFYGINSRERDKAGFIAEKNRYAPWSGAPMAGRLELDCGGQELTLTRTTKRQAAPLSEFQAVYAGTGDSVPGLTGASCGETLLGVSREVFERSAFIRQNGLSITQDASLERRIASLITSGEEDTSYTEASALLKKQLNRRRHNKTGQIPVLETELRDIRRRIDENETLERQLAEARKLTESLSRQETALLEELARIGRWEISQKRHALSRAQAEAQEAAREAEHLRTQTEHTPENETISRLRGAIVNLTTVRRASENARNERDEAMKALLKAEAAVNASPFAGQTPEQVRREIAEPPRVKSHAIPAILAVYGAAALLVTALYFLFPNLPDRPAFLFIGLPVILLSACVSALLAKKSREKAQDAALIKRFGTADQTEIQALADTYYIMYRDQEAAQADLAAKSATADALHASLSSNEQGILLEVRRFAPAAYDIPTADQLLRECAQRRKALAEAEIRAREAAMRYDLLAQQTPAAAEPDEPTAPPARDRETVTVQLNTLRGELAAARSACDRLDGQLRAGGDTAVLRSAEAHLARQIETLETEYEAIQLAMATLESANTDLQNRFSPALGRRAAEIFAELTDGRYSGVVLDRSFRLSAEPAGDPVYRDAAFLSAGTVDQLYLATRLAICDLVLPEENAVPLVLDDALANFDDERCAAALRWLKEESKRRQILLFTCHSREAEFFAADEEVSVQRLTDAV